MKLVLIALMMTIVMFQAAACSKAVKTPPPEVTIYFEDNAQFELISPAGTRVMIDVASPNALSSPPTEKDILLTTHSRGDHLNVNFADAFPGQQIKIEQGEIELPDVRVFSIQGSHNSTPPAEQGDNFIFVIDMGLSSTWFCHRHGRYALCAFLRPGTRQPLTGAACCPRQGGCSLCTVFQLLVPLWGSP
jgi:hypothetical protein